MMFGCVWSGGLTCNNLMDLEVPFSHIWLDSWQQLKQAYKVVECWRQLCLVSMMCISWLQRRIACKRDMESSAVLPTVVVSTEKCIKSLLLVTWTIPSPGEEMYAYSFMPKPENCWFFSRGCGGPIPQVSKVKRHVKVRPSLQGWPWFPWHRPFAPPCRVAGWCEAGWAGWNHPRHPSSLPQRLVHGHRRCQVPGFNGKGPRPVGFTIGTHWNIITASNEQGIHHASVLVP